jgi:hypothetical protein
MIHDQISFDDIYEIWRCPLWADPLYIVGVLGMCCTALIFIYLLIYCYKNWILSPLTPAKEAQMALDKLIKQCSTNSVYIVDLYTNLVQSVRIYLHRRFGEYALSATDNELFFLAQRILPDIWVACSDIGKRSNAAKFGALHVSRDQIRRDIQVVVSCINETEKMLGSKSST